MWWWWLIGLIAIAALVIAIIALVNNGGSASCHTTTGATGVTGPIGMEPLLLVAISSDLGDGSITQAQTGVIDLSTGGAIMEVYDPNSMFDGSTTITVPTGGTYRVTTRAWGEGSSASPFRTDMFQFVNGISASQIQQQAATFASISNVVEANHTMTNIYTVAAGTQFTFQLLPVSPNTLVLRSGFFEVAQLPP
jgi:hypothetical protein